MKINKWIKSFLTFYFSKNVIPLLLGCMLIGGTMMGLYYQFDWVLFTIGAIIVAFPAIWGLVMAGIMITKWVQGW